MKNQYIADIGDYGKYSLLRHFAQHGISVGVNWYLTEDDGGTDGKFTDYLKKPEQFQLYDPYVFGKLQHIAEKETSKSISDIESADIIPDAVYFSEVLQTDKLHHSERIDWRHDWFSRSLEFLAEVDLIFADPDNGVLSEKKSLSSKGAEKYVTTDELAQYYNYSDKCNVVYYCHKGRRRPEAWKQKKNEMRRSLPDVNIRTLTFHRGTQRSYIFLIHPDSIELYDKLLANFLQTNWSRGVNPAFTLE